VGPELQTCNQEVVGLTPGQATAVWQLWTSYSHHSAPVTKQWPYITNQWHNHLWAQCLGKTDTHHAYSPLVARHSLSFTGQVGCIIHTVRTMVFWQWPGYQSSS